MHKEDITFSYRRFENSLDPHQMPENEWIDNVAVWPPVEFSYTCVYSSLIAWTGEFTEETLGTYTSS